MEILYNIIFGIGIYCIGVVLILIYHFHIIGRYYIDRNDTWYIALSWPLIPIIALYYVPYYYIGRLLLNNVISKLWSINHTKIDDLDICQENGGNVFDWDKSCTIIGKLGGITYDIIDCKDLPTAKEQLAKVISFKKGETTELDIFCHHQISEDIQNK